MFTNKHVIIALIVAPILSILAFYGVDNLVSETPHKAVEGASYPLVAKSNCRYSSGTCTMENGEFSLTITLDDTRLLVQSPLPLSTLQAFIVTQNNDQSAKYSFEQTTSTGQNWTLQLTQAPRTSDQLRIVTIAADSVYYGETEMTFIHYQTIFDDNFIRE